MNERTAFLEDLKSLLEKHKVEFSCYDHWGGYAECGQDVRITAEFNDYTIPDIDFKTYIDPEKCDLLIEEIASG